MEILLSAIDWLKEEQLSNPKVLGSHPEDDIFQGYDCSTVMERYANYKARVLEVSLLTFRQKFKDMTEGDSEFLDIYDEHFGITKQRYGNADNA